MKVLTNQNPRQSRRNSLANILEQCLSPDQYEMNVAVRPNSSERRISSNARRDSERPLYLPIDSKFPVEDYQRLVDAYEHQGSELKAAVLKCGAQCAREIHEKYIYPPHTTDFAIMFVRPKAVCGDPAAACSSR